MPTLFIVATPIGNLEDITLRALRILKEVDLILCEDTRTTKKLLSHYDIGTPTMSYHVHSTLSKVEHILDLLREGKTLALVSDAGTPTISDPGVLLVSMIRTALPEVRILPVPGPSAVIAALSISGLSSSEFLFMGFLPHKKGRDTLFGEIANSRRTVVFYESPHRIMKTLASLQKSIPDRRIIVARELTKIFEEALSGTPADIHQALEVQPARQRGEFVVVVSGK